MATVDEQFEKIEQSGSLTYPTSAGSIQKNSYMMIKGCPCKVVDVSHAKPGKHGAAKANIVGIDIFTGNKVQDSCGTGHNVEVPYVNRKEFQLINVEADGFVSLMLEDGTMKEDLKLPADEPELCEKIRNDFDDGKELLVTLILACGREKIVAHREINAGLS